MSDRMSETGSFPANAKLGKYELKQILGKGATGTVYLAFDPFSKRDVAIKVAHEALLKDKQQGARYRKIVENEASLAGKLNHPHLVNVFDAAVEADYGYVVMEYLAGGTLEKYTRAETLLPIESVVEIIFKCCGALDYAFKNGLIHRDIKPANIMMVEGTDIKIADFGAALSVNAQTTQISGFVGSPAYMSPEQTRERPLTHQSDIFSLGVVMYELITAHQPFVAENDFAVIHKINNEDPPPMNTYREGVAPELEKILRRAIARDRDDRYQTWVEFMRDLASVFDCLHAPIEIISDTEKFNSTKNLSFFEDFSDAELWEVLRISSWARLKSDTILIEEGNVGRSFYILADGQVTVSSGGQILNVLSPGVSFGEMAYLSGKNTPRTATVTSNTPVLLIKIRADALKGASERLQGCFNRVFIRLLVERLAQADRRLAML